MDSNASMETMVTDIDDDDYYTSFAYIHAIVMAYVIYPAILIFGLVGNLLVICSVLRDKSKRTVTNVFMFNLAVANVLLCLFVIPVRPVQLLAKTWPLGSFMCHLWPCIYYSACYISMVSLACIAVNRYSIVVHQLTPQMKMTKWIVIVVIIWIASIAVSLPFGMGNDIIYHTKSNNYQYTECPQAKLNEYDPSFYFLPVIVVFFLIPLIVTASLYIALSIKMSHMSTADCSTDMADIRRTNRLLATMAMVFCVVLMPYHIIELLYSFFHPFINYYHLKNALNIAFLLAISSTCFSPLFYMRLNKITMKQFCLVGPCSSRSNRENDVNLTATNYTIINNDYRASDVTYNTHRNTVGLIKPDDL